MKNKFKQFIALFLCALMVLTSGMFSIGANLAATDDAGAEYAETETEATADTASASSETTEIAEPETTAAAEETAAPEETAEPTAETTAVPEETAAPEETAEATASAEPAATAAPVKTQYDYSDNKVTVTATLSDPSIIPDDAVLKVTPVTKKSEDYNYDAYMEALNQSGASDKKEYTSKNTLLYDICFIETAADGTETEVEPAEGGSVSLNVVFNKDQLTDKLDAEKAEDVTVTHLPINDEAKAANNNMTAGADITASDISVEDVSASASLGSTEQVDFSTDSFTVFAFKAAGVQENTWNNSEGEGTVYTFSDILNGINQNDNVTNFAIYANELDSNQHLEGNVKVGKIKLGNVPLNQDSNVQTRNAVTAIHVTKTVDKVKNSDREFNFGVFQGNNNIYHFSITVPANASSAEVTLNSKNAAVVISALANGNVTVYELDDKGSPVQEGGKNDSYTVHYSGNNVMSINSVSNYDNYIGSVVPRDNADSVTVEPNTFDQEKKGYTTYIEDFSGGQFEGANGNYVFSSAGKQITLKNYEGYDPTCRYIKKGSDITTRVSDTLNRMKEFSARLANAHNGAVEGTGSLSVINLISTTGSLESDLKEANFDEPQNGTAIKNTIEENGYLLINIDATKFNTYYLQQIKIDGYDADNNNEELARHIIFNFVKKNGSTFEAYTGTVKVNNVTAGTVIAPAASYINDGGLRGMVIANTVDRSNGAEIHKDTLTTQKTVQVTIANSEVKPGTLKITKNVTAYGKATTGNEADGTYSFTVKDANGNTAKDIDGKEVGNVSIIITNGQSSTAVVNNLPAGKYTVSENTGNLPAGVSVVGNNSVNVTVMAGTTADTTQAVAAFTNNYENTTHIDGEKIWDDNNNQDGKRPSSITIHLYADGIDTGKSIVTGGKENTWSYSFTNLPKYKDGKEISYTVAEDAVADYTSEINGYNITNTHQTEVTSVSGTKTWNDNNNQDGKRPKSIIVHLYKLGQVEEIAEKTITEADGWRYSFDNLPKYDQGKEIEYRVEEDAVENYQSYIDGYNITNTHQTEVTSVNGTKTWNDNNNQDGKRPSSITIHLYADGNEIEKSIVTGGKENTWSYSFTNLPKYKDGKEISYTVAEDAVAGYTSEINGYNITNTHQTEVTSVSGTKTWNDNNNQDGLRPTSITVHLLANGEDTGKTAVANADGGWHYSFTGLDKNTSDGQVINYTVKEDAVAGYTSEINGYNITNTHQTEVTSVSGTKTWNDNNNQDGKRPKSITVHLYKLGQVEEIAEKTITEADGWRYSFDNLPKYDQGKEIEYRVEEDAVENYQSYIDGYNITNTYKPGTTSVSVKKVWDDDNNQLNIRPSSVTVKLNAEVDGNAVNLGDEFVTEVTLNADNNWSHEWKDLPLNQSKGKKIVYTVKEVKVPNGYSDKISGDAEKGFTITNTAKVAAAIISGTKTVKGLNDLSSVAGMFRFALYDPEGNEIDTAKNAADGSFSFAKLTYTEKGTYKYTVKEINAGRTIDGIKYSSDTYPVTVTVSEKEGKLSASVSNLVNVVNTKVKTLHVVKQWDDDNNANHTRPGSITVHLLENGKDKESAVLTAADSWSYDFTGLDPEKTYTVKEVMDENNGYTSKQEVSDGGNTVTLINTFTKTVNLSAHKTLKGALIQNGEFTFKLVRNSDPDNAYYAVNNGSGEIFFNNIPYDEKGYTVTEVNENGDPHITYDTDAITYDKDGKITSEKTEFINTERPAVLRVQKTSKEEPHDPLVGAVYGLYMAGADGTNDVLVEAQTSDANGYMYYTKFQEGVWYYFKEISAPAGHEVDPYPGQKFKIKYQDDGSLVMVGKDDNVISTADITDSTSTGTAAYVQINTIQTDLNSISADEGHVKLESNSDGVKAVAVAVEGALPEDTQLQVKKVNLSEAAEENLKKQIGAVKSVAYYDVSFISNGEKVEPEAGTVTVTIQEDNGTAIPSDVNPSNLKLVHLLDNEAKGVAPVYGSIEVDGNTMHGASVTSSSFSIFGVVEPKDMTAFGSNYLLTASGVSDKVSKVQIAKLDTAGKYVIGADLQIIEKKTGKVVAEWNTSEGNKVFNRFFSEDEPLNVDTDYVLHEVSAPEGYQKADDIVFRLNKYDSSLSIWRYDEKGSLVEDTKSADEAVTDFTLTMTDKPIKVEKDKVYKQKTVHKDTVLYKNNEVTETITTTDKKGNKVTVTRYGTNTVNTGVANHTALYVTLIVIAAAAVIVITVLKNRNRKEAE